jgi:hypothetical protein
MGADAIIDHFTELPAMLDTLANRRNQSQRTGNLSLLNPLFAPKRDAKSSHWLTRDAAPHFVVPEPRASLPCSGPRGTRTGAGRWTSIR